MSTDLILGTAGHIDHGKTSLIRALTGIDTDRLPEEKRRGITIDLGFAFLTLGPYRLGIVDVPGHERFVRNMLAGATGMDLVLLVVAANESVKPQTREHLEILRLLDLPTGVVALTKCDLVEPEWWDAVAEEIREATQGTSLERAPIVPTSVVTGYGLDRLKEELQRAAERAAVRRAPFLDAPFRMPIDRVFAVAGHGTVVTGSVTAGRVRLGDSLVIQPGGISVRVRGLHNHGQAVEEVHRGQRAAINLAGVHHDQITRGHELAAPGHLEPSRVMTVEVRLSAGARPLKNRSRVRVHLGTAEYLAGVRLLGPDVLMAGQAALAQLVLAQAAVAVWQQPFVLRSESPVVTIGGGIVLDPQAQRLHRPTADDMVQLEALRAGDVAQRVAAAVYFRGTRPWNTDALTDLAGIAEPAAVVDELRRRGVLVDICLTRQRQLTVHHRVLERVAGRVETALERMHRQQPLRAGFEPQHVLSRVRPALDAAVFEAAVEHALRAGRIQRSAQGIRLPKHGPALSHAESQWLEETIRQLRDAGVEVPSVSQIQTKAGRLAPNVPSLLELAVARGDLVRISDEFYMHHDVEHGLRKRLEAMLREHTTATVSQIREWLGTSRKYAVPLCEYWDRIGFTERRGDVRVLRSAEPPVSVDPSGLSERS